MVTGLGAFVVDPNRFSMNDEFVSKHMISCLQPYRLYMIQASLQSVGTAVPYGSEGVGARLFM